MKRATTIMLVDDEKNQRELLAQTLENENYIILKVKNGEEAVKKYQDNGHIYDVVLTDVKMPRMSGLELLTKIKGINSKQPVIVMTGHLDIDSTIKAMHLGAFDFIPKPIEINHLKHTLEMCIKTDRLRRDNEAMQERLREELSLAKKIQESLLPDNKFLAELSIEMGITLSASSDPVSEVNGDFYNVRRISKNLLSLSIADCKGHGVSAGMMTMAVITLLNSLPRIYSSAKESLVQLDLKLREFIPMSQFVNMINMLYDSRDGRLILARAGMPYPILFREKDQSAEELKTGGSPLRLPASTVRFEEVEIVLGKGDKLIFFSDGLTEAVNSNGEMFGGPGSRRLCNLVKKYGGLSCKKMHKKLIKEWEDFCKDEPPLDDCTLFIVRKD